MRVDAKYYAMHQTAPKTKNYLAHNVNGVQAKGPALAVSALEISVDPLLLLCCSSGTVTEYGFGADEK